MPTVAYVNEMMARVLWEQHLARYLTLRVRVDGGSRAQIAVALEVAYGPFLDQPETFPPAGEPSPGSWVVRSIFVTETEPCVEHAVLTNCEEIAAFATLLTAAPT